MTGTEFQKIILTINAFWQPKIESSVEMDLWYRKLKDLDYQMVSAAVDRLSDTETFRPNPAKINEIIEEFTGTKRMTASEAWGMVIDIGLSTYTPPERLAELPKDVQQALRSAGSYYNLARGDLDDARKAFMGAWKAMGDTEHREQVQRIGCGLKQIGG